MKSNDDLTESIGAYYLAQKHRQCHGRPKLWFPLLGEVRLRLQQQLRAGEQVEEMVGIDFLDVLAIQRCCRAKLRLRPRCLLTFIATCGVT